LATMKTNEPCCRLCRSLVTRCVANIITAIATLAASSIIYSGEGRAYWHEDFSSLENWITFSFKNVRKQTDYSLELQDSGNYLKISTNDSASALINTNKFDVYRHPNLKWRWKISNTFQKGDATLKAGDDYPIRVYVMFEFEPAKASFRKKAQYAIYKTLNGYYPPGSSLNYIWANKTQPGGILSNVYASESKMIILQVGDGNAGLWMEETVNILDDYRRAFGSEPPNMANIAIMGDADDTGESAAAWIDFVEVFSTEE